MTNALARAVSALGHAWPATRSGRLLILIYHRVLPSRDPMFPGEVDAERFAWQMDLVRRFCHPVSLAEGVKGLAAGDLPPRSVAITFDDGYADNAAVALPILLRHGLTATFFIAPGFLDGGRMWNDSIIESVRRAGGSSVDLREFQLGKVALGPESTRGPIAEAVIRNVKHMAPRERQEVVDRLCAAIGAELPEQLMMTSREVRRLAESGMAIGAHTMTHPILRTLDIDAATNEIRESREALQAITGEPVRCFAYPNGRPGEDYTERDRDIVASLGFDFAPSTRWGAAMGGTDIFQLPRFTPWDRSPARWLTRLLMMYSQVESA